jgi:hypothetical protein
MGPHHHRRRRARRPARPKFTLGDVVLAGGPDFLLRSGLPFHKQRAFHRIAGCGTGVLGWYLRECDHCGLRVAAGKQCHDRNCPSCGGRKAIEWVRAREAEILPCPYFHCVFTLPDELRVLALENEALLYDILFTASRETLLEFALDPKHLGAVPAMFQVLHTTTRSLEYHPHCHVAISAGGYRAGEDRWVPSKRSDFLFPVRAMARVFRGIFLAALKDAYAHGKLSLRFSDNAPLADPDAFRALVDKLYAENWNVYTKKAFGGPKSVVRYLGTYTHKTAISNRRIRDLTDRNVTYTWFDGRSQQELSRTLPIHDFLKKLARHVLPRGFHRVRHAGLLARNQRGLLRKAQLAARRVSTRVVDSPNFDRLQPRRRRRCPCDAGTLQLKSVRIHRADYTKFPHPKGVALPWGYSTEAA